MADQVNFKAGYIAIIGRPNVGKSTLLNRLLDFKLSITSPRPQTTRRRVMGILNLTGCQVIFLDTPGILEPKYELQRAMLGYVRLSVADADTLLYLIDNRTLGQKGALLIEEDLEILNKINASQKPVILAVNKIDMISKKDLLPLMETLNARYKFEAMIPVSALRKDGLEELQSEFLRHMPLHPPFYDPEMLTEQPERFFVSELIREQIFLYFREEVPYSTEIQIEEFKERGNKKIYISAIIITERSSQKGILIGKRAVALKEVGSRARKEIEKFLKKHVYLDLRVKVSKDWRKEEDQLRRFGY